MTEMNIKSDATNTQIFRKLPQTNIHHAIAFLGSRIPAGAMPYIRHHVLATICHNVTAPRSYSCIYGKGNDLLTET